MKESQGTAVANQNRLVRDPDVGKLVVIIRGQFKGHCGRVTYADDRSAKVELSSQCKIIPIDRKYIKLAEQPGEAGTQSNMDGRSVYGGQSMHGGATVYDGQKTTMARNTPSHYPQSMWGGDNDAFDGNDGGQQDFMRVPGSEHYPDFNYNTGAAAGSYKRERDQ